MPQRLPKDVTIEEIGGLVNSLTKEEMTELVQIWLDDATKTKLLTVLEES